MTTWFDHLLVLLLVVVFPAYGAVSYRRFVARIRAGVPGVRLREYRFTLAIEWALTAVALVGWYLLGRPWAALGLDVPPGGRTLLGLGIMLAGLAFLAVQWRAIRRLDAAGRERLAQQVATVSDFMPHTEAEHRAFQALAITAGVCEVLYRGFLVWYAALFVGLWPAVVLTGVAFGVAHWYQGPAGVLKTGVVGLIMGALYAATGSLLWPVVLHAAIDLQGGGAAREMRRTATA